MSSDSPLPSSAPPPLPEAAAPSLPAGIGKVLLLCCAFYGITIFGTIVDETFAAFTGIKAQPVVSLTVQLMVAWPLTLWISARLTNRPWKALYSLGPFPKSYCLPSLLAGFGLCILLSELASFIPMPPFIEEFFLKLLQGNRFFAFLGVCLVAPIMEELFFRGFVLRSFLERYSLPKAVIVSSFLFAVFHLNPWQAIVAFGIGLLNAWLVLRTGSVVPGMLVHFATNFTSAFLLFALAALFGFSPEDLVHHDHFPWQILAVGIVATVCGLLWLLKLKPTASDRL